ncbi:MAG: DpnD/PcfM family protein, partial [Dysgonamonadaceae bacterium]|nr:DpnD/PcfM family protein [Dysgonamonadaceae bacterium]
LSLYCLLCFHGLDAGVGKARGNCTKGVFSSADFQFKLSPFNPVRDYRNVKAANIEEAKAIVSNQYKNEEIVLDYNDFISVEINATRHNLLSQQYYL